MPGFGDYIARHMSRGPVVALALLAGGTGIGYLLATTIKTDIRAGPDIGQPGQGGLREGKAGMVGSAELQKLRDDADAQAKRLAEVVSAVGSLSTKVDHFRSELGGLRDDSDWKAPQTDGNPRMADVLDPRDSAGGDPADVLEAEFHWERSGSDWGQQVSSSIDTGYANRVGDSAVFSTYPGFLDSECRETVCRVRWGSPDLAALEASERAEVFERARWDLMAIIGQSGVSGQVAISTQERNGTPEMTVLIKQDGGGSGEIQSSKLLSAPAL
jgi:hypothetical protein